MKKISRNLVNGAVIGVLLLAMLLVAVRTVSAQTYYQNYVPQSQAEFVAYLYQLIEQFQAQQQNRQPVYQPTWQYNPVPTVLGSNANSRYDLEVVTTGVSNIDGDEAWAFGFVELNGAPFATVFFEYGESRSNLNERSARGRLDRSDSESFRADLEDLDEGETIYYRAVAQDPSGRFHYGQIEDFEADKRDRGRSNNRNRNDDEPDVFTGDADDIDEDSAEIEGEVDMNDFRNGLVFFVYGEDEDEVEDVEDEDEYRDIDEDGDDLQKFIVDNDLDDDEDYTGNLRGLDDDTRYYYRICVEYEDEDDDETIECGDVEDFDTDRD